MADAKVRGILSRSRRGLVAGVREWIVGVGVIETVVNVANFLKPSGRAAVDHHWCLRW